MTKTMARAIKPFIGIFQAKNVSLFLSSVNLETFSYFSKYDYSNWKPPLTRRNWIKTWVQDGEFLDIGCGGYPVSMDVASSKLRGVGADISLGALKRFRHYFKEFLFLDIEHVCPREATMLRKRFPTIIMSETLEHFSNPFNVLKRIRTFLSPGGRLLITYPNAFSFAQYVDWVLHFGRWSRFEEFHESHIYLVRKNILEDLFIQSGYRIVYFDFRPSNLVANYPNETNQLWKFIARFWPSFLGHQFFYVLSKEGI